MDIQMPELNGFETTAEIRVAERQTGRHIPIVAITAHATKGFREKCITAGMDGYISKPIQIHELQKTIVRLTENQAIVSGSDGMESSSANCLETYDERTALKNFNNNKIVFCEVIEIFLRDGPSYVHRVQRSIAEADLIELGEVAHQLKGVTSLFSAGKALEEVVALEELAKKGELGPARHQADRVIRELKLLNTALNDYLADAFQGDQNEMRTQ